MISELIRTFEYIAGYVEQSVVDLRCPSTASRPS